VRHAFDDDNNIVVVVIIVVYASLSYAVVYAMLCVVLARALLVRVAPFAHVDLAVCTPSFVLM
jgi:hypothetical protein